MAMIRVIKNDLNYLVATEQESVARLDELQARIMQAKALSNILKKRSGTDSCLKKIEDKLAQLQQEARRWHSIRSQTIKAKDEPSHPQEEAVTRRNQRATNGGALHVS